MHFFPCIINPCQRCQLKTSVFNPDVTSVGCVFTREAPLHFGVKVTFILPFSQRRYPPRIEGRRKCLTIRRCHYSRYYHAFFNGGRNCRQQIARMSRKSHPHMRKFQFPFHREVQSRCYLQGGGGQGVFGGFWGGERLNVRPVKFTGLCEVCVCTCELDWSPPRMFHSNGGYPLRKVSAHYSEGVFWIFYAPYSPDRENIGCVTQH